MPIHEITSVPVITEKKISHFLLCISLEMSIYEITSLSHLYFSNTREEEFLITYVYNIETLVHFTLA